ncbi:hypothetical protein Pyn_19968 [Prunus yedoensis var. nudiflora]|uniref:Secreted protein n=1 Tax=Prunus yedoensis var. nudiflora TaxID=2094558 RepID=A0A314ZK09_PRUYE|nr:hypothetical protein Pyn_19968 [Prunus yedoensis var. nudiflora]
MSHMAASKRALLIACLLLACKQITTGNGVFRMLMSFNQWLSATFTSIHEVTYGPSMSILVQAFYISSVIQFWNFSSA